MTYFTVYKGEEIVCFGGKAEVAEKLGVKESTVHWLATPSARRRADKPGSKRMFAERVEVD